MDNQIRISFIEYDNNNDFMTIEKNGKNLWFDLGLCQYQDEMQYWEFNITSASFQGMQGFILSKELDKDEVIFETERIIKKYDI